MTKEEHESIQRAGANARALGRDLLANPYYGSGNVPATTGESAKEWQAKVQAWEIGWRAEDLARR